MSLYEIVIAAFLGGIIAWDKSSFLLLASEPLIICSAAGAYFGNLEQGILLGIFWQIIWMGELPIGAAKIPDGAVGAFISTGIYLNLKTSAAHSGHISLTICLVIGVFTAYLGGEFISDKRRFNTRYMNLANNFALQGKIRSIENLFFLGLMDQFFTSALFTALVYIVCFYFVNWIIAVIPSYWDGLFASMNASLWGLTAALMIDQFLRRKTIPAMALGIIAGVAMLFLM